MEDHATSQKCRICGNETGNKSYVALEMMYGLREEFDYYQCGQCNCLQIEKIPSDMSKYYPGDYVSFNFDASQFAARPATLKERVYKASLLRRNGWEKVMSTLFQPASYKVYDLIEMNPDTRVLDVGCGNGQNFLVPLSTYGFKNILGCDPFITETIEYPSGLTIEKKDILEVGGTWDLITYHHAFEHIANPLENLVHVKSLLAEGGMCIIRIPTVSSYAWEHYGIHWFQLDAPRHFFLHSVESIQFLANEAGLELVHVLYDSNYHQFMESERRIEGKAIHEPDEFGLWQKIWHKVIKKHYKMKARKMNRQGRGDQAAFYLRQPRQAHAA